MRVDRDLADALHRSLERSQHRFGASCRQLFGDSKRFLVSEERGYDRRFRNFAVQTPYRVIDLGRGRVSEVANTDHRHVIGI